MRFSSRARLGLFLILLLVFTVGLGLYPSLRGVAWAVNPQDIFTHIWLSQKVAPPTASMQVKGSGFGQSETVSINLDTAPLVTATTDTTGTFAVRFTIPKNALPGTHTVQATGLSSGVTAQTSLLVRTDWAQFRFGAFNTGHNPYENVLNPSNVSKLVLDWSYTSNTGSAGSISPVVAGGVFYVGTVGGTLYALDATTGTYKWSYPTGKFILSSPAVDTGKVYFDSYDGYLSALDATTGALQWRYPIGNSVASPTVINGVVYVGSGQTLSSNPYLYALDATTGTLKWSFSTGSTITNKPAVANDTVYFGTADGKLYALDATTGTFKWSYTAGNQVDSSPTVSIGVVYISSSDGYLYALDAATGMLKWRSAIGSTYSDSSPITANGVVYVGSDNHILYALDRATGTLDWSYNTGSPFNGSSPVVVNGVVYCTPVSSTFYAFHLPGMS